MGIPDSVATLVSHFRENQDHYTSTGYNETQCRVEFINPFFKALGWDVDNESGNYYRDVIHEAALKIGAATKAPDYCFCVGPGPQILPPQTTRRRHTPHDQTILQRQIDGTDSQIDRMVYDLYGLTQDEIEIVEEATQPKEASA